MKRRDATVYEAKRKIRREKKHNKERKFYTDIFKENVNQQRRL